MTFALLLVCFFLSGFSALLYETAWTREFAFVFGTSELAVAAVLAAYMGGLALGAAVAARVAPRIRRPVLAYGVLELAIALWALAMPFGIRALTTVYLGWLGGLDAPPETMALTTALFHLAGAFVVLVPCTALMGATLPLLARHAVRKDAQVGPRVGLLYAINTFGAIGGTTFAAFVLLPALGLRQTVYVGVAINALIFVAAWLLARVAPAPVDSHAPVQRPFHWILPAICLSGAASFAYEVLWVRMLGYVLGGSTAAFSTMLASFLLGIALGSAVAARFAKSAAGSAAGFGIAQVGTAIFAFGAFQLADQLPALARALGASPSNLAPGALLAGGIMLPMTLCIGASFPFAVRLFARDAEEATAGSARVYAWNTLGSILGSVGTGFFLLPALAFEGTMFAGVAVNLGLALAAATLARPLQRRLAVVSVALLATALLLPNPRPDTLLRTSVLNAQPFQGEIKYFGVGRAATVALIDDGESSRVTTNGLPESAIEPPSTPPNRFTAVNWLSMLPVLARPDVEHMLIVGLGGGNTLASVPSTVDHVDVIELEPEVVAANRAVPDRVDGDPLADPRVRLLLGDARGALMLSERSFDAIVSQPSHPWTSGASHLYTREFFRLVESRLTDDGVFVQWIGLSFVDEELARMLVASMLDVFEYVDLYRPVGPALVFAASNAPMDTAHSAARALEASPGDFEAEGLHRVEDVWAGMVALSDGARAIGAGAPINTDDHNRLATKRRPPSVRDYRWIDEWIAEFDPIPELLADGDPVAVARRLARLGQRPRARRVLAAAGGVQPLLGEGWIAHDSGRRRPAARSFRKALAIDPDAQTARYGLALLQADPDLPNLPERVHAVVQAEHLRRAGRVGEIEPLDDLLGSWRPGELLFEDAAQLRMAWRFEAGGTARGEEALVIADSLLRRNHTSAPFLLRARAAAQAGRQDWAWASLLQLSVRLSRIPAPELARRALVVARQLDSDPPNPRILPVLRHGAR
jgi:spermidine synthase